MDINEKLKPLSLKDRITILQYIARITEQVPPPNLALITANCLLFKLENGGQLPDELIPEKWHLPKEDDSSSQNLQD